MPPIFRTPTPGPVITVAIDPGVRGTGVAVFTDGVLVRALVVAAFDLQRATGDVAHVCAGCGKVSQAVIELPQIYAAAKQDGDPNDLISIAAVAGAAAGVLAHAGGRITYARPAEWKGQAPKAVIHARMHAILSDAEAAIAARCLVTHGKRLGHNGLDAVALGLWFLGRKGKR